MRAKRKISAEAKALKLPIAGMAVLLVAIAIAIAFTSMSLTVAPVMAQQDEVTVTVNAPEYVEEGATFDVTIDVDSVTNFTTGLFDLSFDRSVVDVEDVEDGSIDGTTIPVDMWEFMERDTIRVFVNLPGDTAVTGSGYSAKIRFKVKGDEGDECILDIENGFVSDITAEEIPAEWIDAEIKIGGGEEDRGEEEQPPDITAWEPTEAVVSSTEGESLTFEITVDQTVDISWQINGTEVQTDEGVTKAAFTKSAVAGTWNVSAIATSKKTGLSSMHIWIWSVRPASTTVSEKTPALAPTPTLAPGVTPTPTPTLAPGVTPKPAATTSPEGKPKPTVKPTSPPKSEEATPTPTPTPAMPGFEAVFAIAVIPEIAYMLSRRRRERR